MRWKTILHFLFFILIVSMPILAHLDELTIQVWDESRNAVESLEMMDNGKYFVRHLEGKPDTWETKPPLLMWIQIPLFKIFGISVLTARLPTALAMLGMCILFWYFFRKEFNDTLGAWIAALALVTSEGVIRWHVSRTGDHDALLCFFALASLMSFYRFARYRLPKH
jgi:4-amino-4-deoxy-L-arabinose transferase-like glycosyltransferase